MNLFQWRSNNVFEVSLRVHSMAFRGHNMELDNGGKILLPQSALDSLTRMNISWPVFFSVRNPATRQSTHCGVQEFTAEEGLAYLPYWVMKHLGLAEGSVAVVRQTDMLPGTFAKIQPHSKDFLDISNPRAVLEKHLRDYSCMTTGDVFQFTYNDKKFAFNVLEVRPGNAVSIVETDMNVDFAPPLDYVEPEKPKEKKADEKAGFGGGGGGGVVLQPDVHVVPTLRDSQTALTGGQRLGGEKKVKTEASAVAAAAPAKTRLTLGTPATPLMNAPPPAPVETPSGLEKVGVPLAGSVAAGGVDHKKKKEEYWASLGDGQSLKKK